MRKIFKNSIDKNNLLIIFFLIIVVGDALTKIFLDTQGINPSKYVKAFLLGPLILMSFKVQKKLFIYLSISFFLLLIGSLSISTDRFVNNIPKFFEYYFFVLFFTAFLDINYKKIGLILEMVFLFHALVIILAAVFEYQFLKTYLYSERIGYLSFFNSQNEFSYVIMAGITFFAVKVKINNILSILKVLIMIFAGLMTGTKAVALFLILLCSYFLFIKTKPKIFLPIIAFVSVIALIFWQNIVSFLKVNYNALYGVYQREGFLSFLSSQRTELVWERYKANQIDLSLPNYFVGSYDLSNLYEMSILDIPFFFGFIGAVLYCYIVYRFVIKRIPFNQIIKVHLLIVVGLSLVAGYLFENASAQVYTLLVILYLSETHDFDLADSERKKEKIKA